MGGLMSGRYGGRPTVESTRTLDLYKHIRQGLFRPGHNLSGSIVWTRAGSDKPVLSIDYEAHMAGDTAYVRLCHTITNSRSAEVHEMNYEIALATSPQPLGGRRWWFVCPVNGDLVAKLHLPAGAYIFASRRAHGLGYRSQRETPLG